MPRRRDTCAQCGRNLPDEYARDPLTAGTDVCLRCASIRLHEVTRTAEGRRWLEGWREKLRTALQLQNPPHRG